MVLVVSSWGRGQYDSNLGKLMYELFFYNIYVCSSLLDPDLKGKRAELIVVIEKICVNVSIKVVLKDFLQYYVDYYNARR